MDKSKYQKYVRGGVLPINRVVSVIPTEPELEVLIEALEVAGYTEEHISILYGEHGKEFIDADGSRGLGFVRKYQRLSGKEARMIEMAEKGLEAGHYLIGVMTNGQEEQWKQVGEIFKQHTKQSIFFCGKFTIHPIQ